MAALQLARRHLWMAFGWASLSMGAIGVVLPLLPTTPFLILAAYCFSRSSQRLHAWLLNHPILGPPIENWRAHRAISGRAKLSALAAMALILALSAAADVPAWVLAAQTVVLAGVAVFLLTRPTPPKAASAKPSAHSGTTRR
ncbi:MAG: YbaN family protein [Gammaproteobacteria bacterium]|nr:YbaN family protein [Gammaproteobacteria bacterium]MCY4343201.1 YbaN family protein [Gammaproteobacteria bacterium]